MILILEKVPYNPVKSFLCIAMILAIAIFNFQLNVYG